MSKTPAVAKVTPPRLMDLQPRKRLFRQLDALRRKHKVPWVATPAGSGKTSLLVSYAEERGIPTIWYRVDEADCDPANLFYYMRLALQTFEGTRRAGVDLPSFSSRSDVMPFARRFFEVLFARLPPKAMIVLDDYHLAYDPSPWQVAIEKAIECIPTGMNVVVLSRRLPPAALARPRVHGDIAFLEPNELHLTEQETTALAKRRLGRTKVKLTTDELRKIHRQTGGWAAGVSLLLRSHTAKRAVVRADQEEQPIFDFLASAVFSGLTPETQKVLLHTACLPSFTAAQAAELSGVARAREVLRTLHRDGLFIGSDSAKEETFRLHHLFRAFLVDRAKQAMNADEMRGLRRRAAALMQTDGRFEEAFDLLAELGDGEQMGNVILERAACFVAEGRTTLLERWLGALPVGQVEATAWLSYWRGMGTVTTAPIASRADFERALEKFMEERNGAGAYLAWAGTVHASTYELQSWRADERWLERLTKIERFCPTFPSAEIGSQVASALLMGLTLAGAEAETLDHWAGRALSLVETASDATVRVMTTSVLLLNYAMHGDSGRTAILVAKLGQESRTGPAGFLAQVAAKGAIATLAWHRGDFDTGLEVAHAGVKVMAGKFVPLWSAAILVCGAWCAFERNELSQGRRFRELLGDMAESATPFDVASYHIVRAHEAITCGDWSRALLAAQLSLDACRIVGFPYGQAIALANISYLAFELGEKDRASQALTDLKCIEKAQRDPTMTYWRLLIEADRALQRGDRPQAVEIISHVFRIGREHEIYGAHCPSKERVSELCRVALTEHVEVEYSQTLVRRRRLVANPPPLDVPDWPWPVRISVLGPLRIELDDDTTVTLGRTKMPTILLLALVALGSGGRPVTVEKVVSVLWPDADGDMGMRTFDVTLLRLRRLLGSLGPDAIRLQRGRLALDTSMCWTDVDALEAMRWTNPNAHSGKRMSSREETALAEQCLALYRGPFGGEVDDLPPALIGFKERTRLKMSASIAALGRRLGELQRGAEETLYTRALGADQGLALRVPLVRCLARSGQQHRARELITAWRLEVDAREGADLAEAARLIGS